MSHLNFCPIKTDLSGNTVWPLASDFQKLAKVDHFWHFYLKTLVQTLLAMLNETFSVIFKHRASYVYFLSNFRLQQIKYTLGISQPFSSPILELKTSFRIPESNSSTKVISQGIRDRHCHKISTSILQFCVWLYPFARIDVTIALGFVDFFAAAVSTYSVKGLLIWRWNHLKSIFGNRQVKVIS